ncbi:MAG: hypothetical protein HC854_12165 [Flavobacterium sp.]|nr:hypothetical protein [Flavobacterium sp.]
MGEGVSSENLYSNQLENLLNRDNENNFEVMNFGVSGYGLTEYIKNFELKLKI